jgi:hypothetical protein
MAKLLLSAAAVLGIFIVCFPADAPAEGNNTTSTTKCKDGKTVTVSVAGKYGGCSKTWINGQPQTQCGSDEQKSTGGCDQNGNSFCGKNNTGACTVSRAAAKPSTKGAASEPGKTTLNPTAARKAKAQAKQITHTTTLNSTQTSTQDRSGKKR